ncbi:MAG: hypothetical protein M3167_05985 [Acidobacteriota bacterium]|nr:hypothetical protein [Acidobacteriota bacterium]
MRINEIRAFFEEVTAKLVARFAEENADEVYRLEAGEEAAIECGRSGTFVEMGKQRVTFTPTELAQIAADFSTEEEHKVKIGHKAIETDTPDYGDVQRLTYDEGRDRLIAHAVPTAITVRKNREEGFRRCSMELVKKGEKWAFEHLALLGARKPAISGLAPIALADGTQVYFASPEGAEAEEPAPDEAHFGLTAAQRKAIADEDFAGPDRSFPIDTQAHLDAAAKLIGKAADPAAVKAKAIAIAKRKGLTLPEAWDPEDVADKGADEATEEKKTKAKAAAPGGGLDTPATLRGVTGKTEEKKTMATPEEKAAARLARFERDAKQGAKDRAKAFLAANVKRIPLKAVKAGIETMLSALFEQEALAEEVTSIKFEEGGKEVEKTPSEIVVAILEALPEQVTTVETTETTADGGADDKPKGVGPELNLAAVAATDPEGDEFYDAAQAEIAASAQNGQKPIDFETAAARVYAKRGSR